MNNRLKIYTFKEVEEHLKTLKPIKFKGDYEFKNIAEVIKKLLHKCTDTYSLENKLQCQGYKSRGLCDIYRICKFYIPTCTLEDVYKVVMKKTMLLRSTFCNETNQTVFYRSGDNIKDLPTRIRKTRCRTAVRID